MKLRAERERVPTIERFIEHIMAVWRKREQDEKEAEKVHVCVCERTETGRSLGEKKQ